MAAGEVVTWTNHGGAAHTVTIPSLGIDERLEPGESFQHAFDEPGTYAYKCALHPPGMAGRVIVVAGAATPNGGSQSATGSPSASNTTTEA